MPDFIERFHSQLQTVPIPSPPLAHPQQARSTVTWPRVRRRRTLLVCLAVLAVAAPAAAIGTVGLLSTAPQPAIKSIQPAQSNGFAIFKTPRAGADSMPAAAFRALQARGAFGMNAGLSRAVRTPSGTGWAIPANNMICLVAPDPVDGYGVACAPTANALNTGAEVIMSAPPFTALQLTLLVPDHSRVTAQFIDGSTRQLTPDDRGIVNAKLTGAKAITLTTPRGAHTASLPLP